MPTLTPERLTREKFKPYGEVIELAATQPLSINSGNCLRYSDLATIDVCKTGVAGISLFDARAYTNPLTLTYVERHPLGSQAFLPTSSDPYLVVVATDIDGQAQAPEVFITDGYQGVNYHRNVWHGVLTPIIKRSLFVVIDYIGAAENLQESEYEQPFIIDFRAFLKTS